MHVHAKQLKREAECEPSIQLLKEPTGKRNLLQNKFSANGKIPSARKMKEEQKDEGWRKC